MADGSVILDLAELKKLKVVQLKSLLAEYGLPSTGLKADLIDRLHNYALQIQAPELADVSDANGSNLHEIPKAEAVPEQPPPVQTFTSLEVEVTKEQELQDTFLEQPSELVQANEVLPIPQRVEEEPSEPVSHVVTPSSEEHPVSSVPLEVQQESVTDQPGPQDHSEQEHVTVASAEESESVQSIPDHVQEQEEQQPVEDPTDDQQQGYYDEFAGQDNENDEGHVEFSSDTFENEQQVPQQAVVAPAVRQNASPSQSIPQFYPMTSPPPLMQTSFTPPHLPPPPTHLPPPPVHPPPPPVHLPPSVPPQPFSTAYPQDEQEQEEYLYLDQTVPQPQISQSIAVPEGQGMQMEESEAVEYASDLPSPDPVPEYLLTEPYTEPGALDEESKGKKRRKKKKKKKRSQRDRQEVAEQVDDEDDVEIEYVPEQLGIDQSDPNYAAFSKIFEAFKLTDTKDGREERKSDKQEESALSKKPEVKDHTVEEEEDEGSDVEEEKKEEDDKPKLSKKKLRKMNRLSVAELKQLVQRPDVVEMHDVTALDPKLLVYLKAYRNTVPVPRHWCFKRKYLQGKRGVEKPPFDLPDFIKKTGVMEMRAAMQEKEDQKTLKSKMREKVRPKMGKIDIDYQKLHDAFFKWQTKPKMTIHGDLYYEGKEYETKLKEKKPGDLSDDLRTALGMPTGPNKQLVPPPWLIAMQRYGPPPSYPNLKIPGLNAPIPEGASFGYHAGGWGKPPVDQMGQPLYGDVFGLQQEVIRVVDEDDQIDRAPWGELESESESEEEESESEEEGPDQTGLMTPAETGLITPSGLSSVPAGMETPDMIELRKRKTIEEEMEMGDQPSLYTVIPEKKTSVGGAMMGSAHIYDISQVQGGPPRKALGDGVEVALDPSELELDPAAMQARYEQQMRERENQLQKEDLSDMVAEHAAKQKKRKKATDSGKATKKYREFKF